MKSVLVRAIVSLSGSFAQKTKNGEIHIPIVKIIEFRSLNRSLLVFCLFIIFFTKTQQTSHYNV